MNKLTVHQANSKEFIFKIGDCVKLIHTGILTYLKVDEPMIVEEISKNYVYFRNPFTKAGTSVRNSFEYMIFEKAVK